MQRTRVAMLLTAALGCAAVGSIRAQGGQLHVCHAGSVLAAFTQVEQEFKAQHPGVTIVDTSGGSVDLARRLAIGSLPCDVFAPADRLVIDTMLKPARLADFTIAFARGRMVLAYMATDPKASALKLSGAFSPPATVPQVAAGWEDVLTAPGVRISGAHPFLDPGGYRAHMIFELAQAVLKKPGLYNMLLQHYQVNVADPTGSTPAATLGKDFSFQVTYEHSAAAAAARDKSYRYAALPREIDLSGTGASYASSRVIIPGLGTPGASASVTIPASRVEWGVTILANSRNRENAIAFTAALLGASGRAAFEANGPTAIVPALVSKADAAHLPASLRTLTNTGS
jgi:molybdate/tungstate transport system substrate-binding protein